MSLLSRFRDRPKEPNIYRWDGTPVEPVTTTLPALLENRTTDLVEIDNGSVLIVQAPEHVLRPPVKAADPGAGDMQMNVELGRATTSWSRYQREDYNPELRGQSGLVKYDRMRRADASVRSSLMTLKTPILGATWFVQPFDNTRRSKEIARFVSRNFTQYMTYSWVQVLWEALLMLDFGHWIYEKVWEFKEIDGQRRVILKKLGSRHPLDVDDWLFDEVGGPRGISMFDASGVGPSIEIPIEKLAIFTYNAEAGDLRGISVLRSAYKHWYFKENMYKIDAIQKERHGIGIPIIKLPANFTTEDRKLAHELGSNLRTNESAHVVLPPNWDIMFAKLEGQPVSPLESAKHHEQQIYQNVLAQALYAATTTPGDSEPMMELFYKSTRHVGDLVRAVFNKYIIPQLVGANWGIEDYPELRIRRLGDTQEARTISFALRNLVGAGIIQVDDRLEEWSREILDAPTADPATRREVGTPQNPASRNVGPPRVGPPRQTTAVGMRPEGQRNEGTDQSGGSR